MPLSEEEQRILAEMEQQFLRDDPQFAREIGTRTAYDRPGRNLKLSILGFVVGTVVLIGCLQMSVWLSFVGFLAMLGSAFVFERNARRLGRDGISSVTDRFKSATQVRDSLGGASQRMRDRFRREE